MPSVLWAVFAAVHSFLQLYYLYQFDCWAAGNVDQLDTLDACALQGGCMAAAAKLLPNLSVYMESDFDNYWWIWWYDTPLPCWKNEKAGGGNKRERGRKSERTRVHRILQIWTLKYG